MGKYLGSIIQQIVLYVREIPYVLHLAPITIMPDRILVAWSTEAVVKALDKYIDITIVKSSKVMVKSLEEMSIFLNVLEKIQYELYNYNITFKTLVPNIEIHGQMIPMNTAGVRMLKRMMI